MTTLLHRVPVPPPSAVQPTAPVVARRALTDRALTWLLAAFALPFALLWRSDRG